MVPWGATCERRGGVLIVANLALGRWIAMYLTMAQEVSAESVSTAAGLLGNVTQQTALRHTLCRRNGSGIANRDSGRLTPL